MQNSQEIIETCKELLNAYKTGKLGQTIMPEDSNPGFNEQERGIKRCLAGF